MTSGPDGRAPAAGELCLTLLTASAPAAVAVLELRADGTDAPRRLLAALRAAGVERLPEPGAARLVHLAWDGEIRDEALCVRSGADRVELHATGSPPVVEALLARLRSAGAALGAACTAEERADEALARCENLAGARILLDQAQGALRAELLAWPALAPELREARRARLLKRSRAARFALRPLRVLLAGPVNAGKSTLANLLCGRESQLVSPVPGTTRDLSVLRARLGEYDLELLDGAGLRAEGDELERAGQDLVRAALPACDLCLWLAPHGRGAAPAGCRVLPSRVDELPADDPLRREGISRLEPERARSCVESILLEQLDLPRAPWPLAEGPSALWTLDDLAAVASWELDLPAAELEAGLRAWLDGEGGPRHRPDSGVVVTPRRDP